MYMTCEAHIDRIFGPGYGRCRGLEGYCGCSVSMHSPRINRM
jgi:hypothetical protein